LIQYNKHNYLNYIYNKIDLDKQENWSGWYNIINTILLKLYLQLIRLIQYNKHNYLNYIYNKIHLDNKVNWSGWYNIINTQLLKLFLQLDRPR
jgi:hypothetical protein